MPKAREGKSTRGGLFPLSLGGFGGPPPRIYFLILSASMSDFNGVLCVWDRILAVLVTKIFLVA